MPLHQLASLGTYEEINRGVHRKAASIVGTPCLVRRLGFWNTGFALLPDAAEPPPAEGQRERRQGKRPKTCRELQPGERAAAFSAYFDDLKRVIEGRKSSRIHFDEADDRLAYEYDSDLDKESRSRKRTDDSDPVAKSGSLRILRFWWCGMLASIRLEYHSEYVTITSILDLSVAADGHYRPEEGQPDFQERMRQGMKLLGILFAAPRPYARQRYRDIAFLQEDLWQAFEDTVLNADDGKRHILENVFGEVFADFRGMVSGSQEPEPSEAGTNAGGRLSRHGHGIEFGLRPPFQSSLPRCRSRAMRHEKPPPGWVRDSLWRLWPLMESAAFLREYEFTVSGFLKGRALYISALGPQPPADPDLLWPWTPVYYYVHAYTDDEWQIGRLIDRINTLGTMRLAATMQITSLFEAGRKVEKLAARIEEVSGSLQEAIKRTKPSGLTSPPRRRVEDLVEPHEKIMAEADEKMQGIQTALKDIDDTVSGNIAYRLERSQYYLNQWKKEVAELREVRVEGFQMYREFVMRRMGEIFGYVDLLRARMGAINSAMAALGRQYASLKIAHVTCSIDGLVSSLHEQNEKIQAQNDLMSQQHRDMEKQEREIRKIQEFGEIALIGAIIPYYLGSAVLHYMLEVKELIASIGWLVLLSVCLGYLLYRIDQQTAADAGAVKRLRPISRIAIAYLILIWVLFLLFELPWHEWIGRAGALHAAPAP